MPKKSNMYQYGFTCHTQPNMEWQNWKKNQLTKWAKKMTGENLSKLARPVT